MSEDNALCMYFVVRESLLMTNGKIAGQVAHACGYLFLRYSEIKSSPEGYLFKDWMKSAGHAKIVLGASDSEWAKVKEEFEINPNCFIVHDAGKTQVMAGTETCMGIWPMSKANAPKILKRLQLLK